MIDKKLIRKVIDIYARAWIEKDPDLITTIFTEDALYYERAFEKPHKGHKGISQYWKDKVVGEQNNIEFTIKNIYLDEHTAIAEWDASFDNGPKNKRTTIREVAILEFEGEKINSLREYWHSKHE